MSMPDDKIFELIKSLPDKEKDEVLDFAGYLKEKRRKKLQNIIENIPEEYEELTEEDLKAIEEAREDAKNGRVSSAKDVYKRLALNT